MSALRAGFAALLLLCLASAAWADVAVPPLTGRIVDRTGTLSADRIAALDVRLRDFEQRKGSQVAVLLVSTTAPETIEQFSIRVAEAWKIGRKKIDDGAILVVAKDDRALRIEVGYGLEGALTDVTAKRIIDEVIVPQFRNGDFAGGIDAGVERILKVIDGEPLPAPKPERTDAFEGEHFNPYLLVLVVIVGGFLRGLFGRLYGALATGAIAAAAAYFLIGTLVMTVVAGVIAFVFTLIADSLGMIGPNGSWSSGSSGGSSSGSGGFSGGGGGFGGGGASGRW